MHEIRPLPAPFTAQSASRRQTEAKSGITGERKAAQSHFMLASHIVVTLPRANDPHLMATGAQAANQPPNRHGNPVHFGRIGFSYEGNRQGHAGSFSIGERSGGRPSDGNGRMKPAR